MSAKPITTFWRIAGMSYLQVRTFIHDVVYMMSLGRVYSGGRRKRPTVALRPALRLTTRWTPLRDFLKSPFSSLLACACLIAPTLGHIILTTVISRSLFYSQSHTVRQHCRIDGPWRPQGTRKAQGHVARSIFLQDVQLGRWRARHQAPSW